MMIFATVEITNYYNDLVKTQRRDLYLAMMFLPASKREVAIAIYALEIELEHIHHVIKEEMIGHIRYAWWRENLDKMASSDHPVLKALFLAGVQPDNLKPLISAYADTFPESPENLDIVMQDIISASVTTNPKWHKATEVILSHRKKYLKKLEGLMLIKLLFV